MNLNYTFNKSTEQQIRDHLWRVDSDFAIALHTSVDIDDYARKLASSAIRVESFIGDKLVVLMALYYNHEKQFIFGSNFSIEKEYRGKGMELFKVLLNAIRNPKKPINMRLEMEVVGKQFLEVLENEAKPKELIVNSIHTEVHHTNRRLILYYRRLGFKEVKVRDGSIYLIMDL